MCAEAVISGMTKAMVPQETLSGRAGGMDRCVLLDALMNRQRVERGKETFKFVTEIDT